MKLDIPDFEGQNKRWMESIQNNADEMFEAMQKKERQATKRFWIPVGISILAFAVALYSLALQIKQQPAPKEQQQPTTQLPLQQDSTKKSNLGHN